MVAVKCYQLLVNNLPKLFAVQCITSKAKACCSHGLEFTKIKKVKAYTLISYVIDTLHKGESGVNDGLYRVNVPDLLLFSAQTI